MKVKKEKALLYSFAVLLLAGISVVMFMMGSSIASLKQHSNELGNQIEELRLDLKEVNGQNGTLLNKCLETASLGYENELQSTGKTVVENGQTVTYHEMKEWQAINTRLEDSRKKCNEQYK